MSGRSSRSSYSVFSRSCSDLHERYQSQRQSQRLAALRSAFRGGRSSVSESRAMRVGATVGATVGLAVAKLVSLCMPCVDIVSHLAARSVPKGFFRKRNRAEEESLVRSTSTAKCAQKEEQKTYGEKPTSGRGAPTRKLPPRLSSLGRAATEMMIRVDAKSSSKSDPAALNQKLARQRSMLSLWDNVPRSGLGALGQLEAAVFYRGDSSSLVVTVGQCRGLSAPDGRGLRGPDPYVKVYLLTERARSAKRKTMSRKATSSPVFNESFQFPLGLSELSGVTVWLSAWHSDVAGRHDFLGEALVPVKDLNVHDQEAKWYQLHDKALPDNEYAK